MYASHVWAPSLTYGRVLRPQLELFRHPQLEKHWRHLQRKEAKAAKQEGHVPMTETPQVTFLPSLVDEFAIILQEVVSGDGDDRGDASKIAYCEVRTSLCVSSPCAHRWH